MTSSAQSRTDQGSRRMSAVEAAREASAQLSELVGREPYAVTSLRPSDDGWTADVEVTEIERVPDTASVMATYHVELDREGRLMAYDQTKRYSRGQTERR
ncbi:gas vesicle protein [Streptomyces sp. NPDC090119]|uniref:gas vesicle protein GvpO n=1 Tax=Streptomyces sp. NPDC090119 TaxID=3365951 RepID=UPI0037F2F2DB